MLCCSNSSSSRGTITYPNGYRHTSGHYRNYMYASPTHYAGCIQFLIHPNYRPYSFSYPGVYTCTIPDSNNNNIAIDFGLYSQGFNSKLVMIFKTIANHY